MKIMKNANHVVVNLNEEKKIVKLCIPRMANTISKEMIVRVFEEFELGYVKNIFVKPCKYDAAWQSVYISLLWSRSENAEYVKERFMKGLDVKIMYSTPWYWKTLLVG